MSAFQPSENFEARWLDSPIAMKQAIHDELDDIMLLLQESTKVNDFKFTTPDLHAKLEHLQIAHLDTLKQLAKKIKAQKAEALIPHLEKRLDDRLTNDLDTLSGELRDWIRIIIKEELDQLD